MATVKSTTIKFPILQMWRVQCAGYDSLLLPSSTRYQSKVNIIHNIFVQHILEGKRRKTDSIHSWKHWAKLHFTSDPTHLAHCPNNYQNLCTKNLLRLEQMHKLTNSNLYIWQRNQTYTQLYCTSTDASALIGSACMQKFRLFKDSVTDIIINPCMICTEICEYVFAENAPTV